MVQSGYIGVREKMKCMPHKISSAFLALGVGCDSISNGSHDPIEKTSLLLELEIIHVFSLELQSKTDAFIYIILLNLRCSLIMSSAASCSHQVCRCTSNTSRIGEIQQSHSC